MGIVITTKPQTTAGPTIPINCPHCKSKSVNVESFEQVDDLGLFYVILLFRLRNTFLNCTSCGKQSIANLSIDELGTLPCDHILAHHSVASMPPENTNPILNPRNPVFYLP